jgi:hypothetical protein
VFHGDKSQLSADAGGPSLDWTVRQFLDGFVMPKYLRAKNRQPGTIKLYYQTVDLWEELTPGNPSLRRIEQEHSLCQDWVESLKERPGLKSEFLADNTIRKLCVHFQKILDLAGPKTRRSRNAAQLFVDVPYLERPDGTHESPDGDFTLEEIGMWLGVCHRAPKSKNLFGQLPGRFHSSLVTFVYNTALRIDTTMTATWDMIGLKPDKPNWITIPPRIYKGRQYGGEFYLNPHARAAIEAVRLPDSNLLFPWRGWPTSQSWLQETRRRLLDMTDIREHRKFGYHGLRKACLTWLAARNPMVAKIVGGHRGGITQEYYVNPKIVEELLDELPQPKPAMPDPQKLLF